MAKTIVQKTDAKRRINRPADKSVRCVGSKQSDKPSGFLPPIAKFATLPVAPPWASNHDHRNMHSRKWLRWRVLLIIALLFPIALWQVTVWTREIAIGQIHERGLETLEIFELQLRSELEKFEVLPKILAADARIVQALSKPKGGEHMTSVNRYLAEINRISRASNIYLVNVDGIAIAASNWNEPKSFVGINIRHRPYFQTAVDGGIGRYFALGFTSHERGYYFAAPVNLNGQVVGVSVVKVEVNRFETPGQWDDNKVVVTDTHGVIFIANDPAWRFQTIQPVDAETLRNIRQSRQYEDASLSSLPIVAEERVWDSSKLVEIRESPSAPSSQVSETAIATRKYLMQRTVMPDIGWQIYVFSNAAPLQRAVTLALAFTVLFMIIAALVALYLLQRRSATMEKLAAEDALRKAHNELEIKVREQTAELRTNNQRLQREIDERKQAENELIQAGKLAALGQLSAGIVHELNQPLAAIRAYANNTQAFLDKQRYDDVKTNLKAIGELIQRLAQMTSHLKTFAHKTPGKITAVSMKQVIGYAVTLIEPLGNREVVEVELELPEEDLLVQGEPVRLEQVVVNLLKNAIEAMHSQEQSKRIHLRLTASPEQVWLSIQDTGLGIAKENLAQIFDPFFTTKEVGEGLGLGLSISNKIVRDFGGSLTATNHPNGGAVFTLTLLRADKSREVKL